MSILLDFLRTRQQAPARKADVLQRFIVARPKMNARQMPEGAKLTSREIVGPRVIVKDHRYYGNLRGLKAHWPQSKLGEWAHHKLVYVLAGRIDFQVGHYSVECGKDYALIIPPGTPEPESWLTYNVKEGFCIVLNVILHPHAVQCFISDTQDEHIRENHLFQNDRLAVLFRMLMEELMKEEKYSHRIGNDLLSAFWTMLQYETEEQRYITPGPVGRPHATQVTNTGFEATLLHHIQTHLNQSLTLESVAQDLYLSRTQFVRQMRRETGKTFIQFLTEYRLSEAKILLRDSDWTVSAIAGFLGFKSSNYFQAVFRRATGQTPIQFRAASRIMV